MIFPLIFAIFCSGRGDIPLSKANHQPSAPVIAHSSRPYDPLRSIKFLSTPLHHYIHEIMIFIPIFAVFCPGRGEYALVLEQPPGLCPSNRTSFTPIPSSSMYQLAVPSIPLLHIWHHHILYDFRYFLPWQRGICPCSRTTTGPLPL
jgi:hypothetical protein